jgi:hypothetical protein
MALRSNPPPPMTLPTVLVIKAETVDVACGLAAQCLTHHQPINVPTVGAQAFLMNYPQGERAITHHAGPMRIGGCLTPYKLFLLSIPI